MSTASDKPAKPAPKPAAAPEPRREPPAEKPAPAEIGGRAGPDPTRYGDWEKNGRCIDF